MKRLIWVVNILLALSLLVAGCGEQAPESKPKTPLNLKVADINTTTAKVELSGKPGDDWVLFVAPGEASKGKIFEHKKMQLGLSEGAKEVKSGKFDDQGKSSVTYQFDSKTYETDSKMCFQAIAGAKAELAKAQIDPSKVTKSQVISAKVPKPAPLTLKVTIDAATQDLVVEFSGKPGHAYILYISEETRPGGGDTIAYLQLDLTNVDRLDQGTLTAAGKVVRRYTREYLTSRYVVLPPQLFFQAIAYPEGLDGTQFHENTVGKSGVGKVKVPAPPAAKPPEQPLPTLAPPPEEPTEAPPGEWKRPCVFDPNPTKPGGYTYVKEGLQVLDQDHRAKWGNNWCGPTAAGISLGYWAENGYPLLVPDKNNNGKVDEEEKYDIIDELGKKMDTDPDEGTSDDDLVDGLEEFIRQMGSTESFTVDIYDSDLGTADPTFADYKRELERCEDVLVGIEWPGGGHWLVGRSVCNVKNPDGTYNVDFIHPGTSRVYYTRMKPSGDIWYGGRWVTFDIMIVVSPKTPPPAPGTCYVGFNNAKPPFDDYRVRRAFSSAIDRQSLLAAIGKDDALSATSFVPPGAWPGELYLYGKVGLPFNVSIAGKWMAEAGKPSKITLGAPEQSLATAQAIAAQWEEGLGIEVELAIMEWGPYLDQLRADAPQAYLLCWSADYKSPYNFLADVFRSDSASNYAQFHNPEYDALLTDAALEADEGAKLEKYIEAERILCETEAAITPLYHYIRHFTES